MKKLCPCFTSIIFLLCISQNLQAQTKTCTGAVDTDWSEAGYPTDWESGTIQLEGPDMDCVYETTIELFNADLRNGSKVTLSAPEVNLPSEVKVLFGATLQTNQMGCT